MNNFSFNGITKDYITVLRGVDRQPWAPIERDYQEIPGRPGMLMGKKRKTKPRPFPIPVLIQADSDYHKMNEDFADWLIHDDAKPLIPDDEQDRTYYAVVDGQFDPEEVVYYGEGVIPFICPDPYKYGEEKTYNVTAAAIKNKGTVEANCTFEVKFKSAASKFKITHEQTGGWIEITWNFVAGSVLEIDLSKRKFLIDGVLHMSAYNWKSKPFKMVPGDNTFIVEPSNATDTKIKFKPRWK